MKTLTKRMIAIIMTLLIVAALLPATASADRNAMIIVELKEPYYGENLNEILPEIKMEVSYPFIEGYAFVVYYAHTSDEDAYAAAAKLAENARVKSAAYCPVNASEPTSRVCFHVRIRDEYFGGYYGISEAELAKLFPNAEIAGAKEWFRGEYSVYFDVGSTDELYELYDGIKASPFFSAAYCYVGDMAEYVTIGEVTVTMKEKYTDEELIEQLSDIGVSEIVESYSGNNFKLRLNDLTLSGTFEAVNKLMNRSDVAAVKCREKLLLPSVMPKEVAASKLAGSERPKVTVATALGALRIAAQLGEAKNDVYDYKLADAIWQYDRDGDNEITVSDALALLRIAADLA